MLISSVLLFVFTSFVVGSDDIPSVSVRIYSNQAEMIQPLKKLPLVFTDEDWRQIRSDSFQLIGQNVNMTSQTITEKVHSFDNAQVLVRSPLFFDKTMNNLVRGILVDKSQSLVQIEDDSSDNRQTLYITVSPDQLIYLEQPLQSRFYVNFTYNTTDPLISVSYLQSNLYWRTQYQLNLHEDNHVLIVLANIRNNKKSAILITQAELIGGDIHLNRGMEFEHRNYIPHSRSSSAEFSHSPPDVQQGYELAGVHVFLINQPFIIDGRTDYVLPMFRPRITVQRFGLISKSFSPRSSKGQVQRSYRLTSDQFIPKGNCVLRESDRIVGEISLPNIGASDVYQFSIGYDADIVYSETVIHNSSTVFMNEFGQKQTRSAYQIDLQIKNFKSRSVFIEYEQIDSYAYQYVQLTTDNGDIFNRHASAIKANITLNPNDDQTYSYRIELIH